MTYSTSKTTSYTKYAFPNISFKETVYGIQPLETYWRNVIGVAGVFSRGPAKRYIDTRLEYASIFGEDETPGSLFVKQAMVQGATNFVISRVMPIARASTGIVALSSFANPTAFQAVVATGDERTVGLTAEFEVIGDVLKAPGAVIGWSKDANNILTEITPVVDKESDLTLGDFDGAGFFDFKAVQKVVTADLDLTTAPISVDMDAPLLVNGVQKLTFLKAATGVPELLAALTPGLLLDGTLGADLQVISYIFTESATEYGVYVKGDTTAGVAGAMTLKKPVSEPTYFPIAYTFRRGSGSELDSDVIPDKLYEGVGTVLGFMLLDATDTSYQELTLLKEDEITGEISEAPTGIKIRFGIPLETAEVYLTFKAASIFSVPFFTSKVEIGETDELATGFPNTLKAFAAGTSGLEILEMLRDAIYANHTLMTMVSDVQLKDDILPYTLIFLTRADVEISKELRYKITRTVGTGDPQDIDYSANTTTLYGVSQKTVGSVARSLPAYKFLYDVNGNPIVYIQALTSGTAGNDIRVSVRPIGKGQFSIDVFKDSSNVYELSIPPENYVVSNYNVDVVTGQYPELLESNLIRMYFVPVRNSGGAPVPKSAYDLVPVRPTPEAFELQDDIRVDLTPHPSHSGVTYLSNIALENGFEPSYAADIPEEDYIEAIRRLEDEDVSIIAVAGVHAGDFRYAGAIQELIAQAETSSPFNGLRIAVIAAPPQLNGARAEQITNLYSSKRLVVVGGYSTFAGTRHLGLNQISPVGYYCGLLATLPIYVSPAASFSGRVVKGVQSLDTTSSLAQLDRITRARVEMLHSDPATGVYKFLNGLSSSNDPDFKWIFITRVTDHIIMNLFKNLQWAKSAPNTADLRTKIGSACDAFMQSMVSAGIIASASGTTVSSTTMQQAAGQVDVRLSFSPIFPADYISVEVVRTISSGFTLPVASIR